MLHHNRFWSCDMARPDPSGRKLAAGRKIQRAGKSISEFCRDYDIGRATFYLWRKQGLAPAVLQPGGRGGRVIITPESEDAWKARHTALAAAG
jgi:transposase-like protein